MAPGPGHAGRLAEDMVEQHIGGAGRVGAGIMADHRVEAEQRLDQRVAEIALQDLRCRAGEEIDDVTLLLQPQPADAAAQLQQRHQVGETAAGIGRGAQQPLADDAHHRIERGRVTAIGFRIGGRMAGDFALGQSAPAGQQIITLQRRQEIVDPAQHDLEAVLIKPHVADHFRLEQPDRIAGGGIAEAGIEFLGHRGAAHNAARFQHRHLQPARGEIVSADQAVMPRPDDQDVAAFPRSAHSAAYRQRLRGPPAAPAFAGLPGVAKRLKVAPPRGGQRESQRCVNS